MNEQKIFGFNDLPFAIAWAKQNNLPLYDIRELPYCYMVGHITLEQEVSGLADDWLEMNIGII